LFSLIFKIKCKNQLKNRQREEIEALKREKENLDNRLNENKQTISRCEERIKDSNEKLEESIRKQVSSQFVCMI
jgi:hypothetical protein